MKPLIKDDEAEIADRARVLGKLLDEKKAKPDSLGFSVRASGPLTDPTRKQKRPLILLSSIGILMVKTGLVPEKISALGIEFSKADQNTILLIVNIAIIYFLFGFIIFIISDFLIWKHSLSASEWEIYPLTSNIFKRRSFLSVLLVWFRIFFEIGIPVLLSIYSIRLLWNPSRQALSIFF